MKFNYQFCWSDQKAYMALSISKTSSVQTSNIVVIVRLELTCSTPGKLLIVHIPH